MLIKEAISAANNEEMEGGQVGHAAANSFTKMLVNSTNTVVASEHQNSINIPVAEGYQNGGHNNIRPSQTSSSSPPLTNASSSMGDGELNLSNTPPLSVEMEDGMAGGATQIEVGKSLGAVLEHLQDLLVSPSAHEPLLVVDQQITSEISNSSANIEQHNPTQDTNMMLDVLEPSVDEAHNPFNSEAQPEQTKLDAANHDVSIAQDTHNNNITLVDTLIESFLDSISLPMTQPLLVEVLNTPSTNQTWDIGPPAMSTKR